MSARAKLLRELRGDLKHLRSKACRLIDSVEITQAKIRETKSRIEKLDRQSK
jgi:hypothetical protein